MKRNLLFKWHSSLNKHWTAKHLFSSLLFSSFSDFIDSCCHHFSYWSKTLYEKNRWNVSSFQIRIFSSSSYFLVFSCWLTDLPFYLAFILPIVLYILINSIFFIIVTYSFLCSKTRQHLRSTHIVESHRLSRFILALCCFILLTVNWIFSLFAVGSIRLVFQIICCISASLTGLSIFILYLLTSKAKQNCWNSKSIDFNFNLSMFSRHLKIRWNHLRCHQSILHLLHHQVFTVIKNFR